MRTTARWIMMAVVLGASSASIHAEEPAPAQPAADPAKQAAMEAMQKLGAPGEAHKALEPLAGTWTYVGQWWMSPEAPPESMTGTAVNTFIFGGRFLKQDFLGEAEGHPPFEGLGLIGYDNLRKEYQSIWLDNMVTGMMTSTGQFDATTQTLADQGTFSCPMTMETHRLVRSEWKIADQDHNTYTSYMRTPEGKEFKSMELRYTRQVVDAPLPCPADADRC